MWIGLVLSSIGFIVPGIFAWRRRKQLGLDTFTSAILTTTSVLYHGTLHPVAHRIDLWVAHTFGGMAFLRALLHLKSWKRQWVEVGIFVGTLASSGVYFHKSKNNPTESAKYWHLIFHLMSQGTWLVHVITEKEYAPTIEDSGSNVFPTSLVS